MPAFIYPYAELVFRLDGQGRIVAPSVPALPAGVTDLIIVSHGWHMDASASQALYEELIGNLASVEGGAFAAAGRQLAVWGVFWPSDRFRDDLGRETEQVLGTAAAAGGGDLDLDVLRALASEMAAFFEVDRAELVKLVVLAKNGGGDANRLADFLREAVAKNAPADAELDLEHRELLTLAGETLINYLAVQPTEVAETLGAGAAAAGFRPDAPQAGAGQAQGFFSGATAGVAKLLNQFAYYELKKRAGLVGEKLAAMLEAAPALDGVRLHLVGHSFGARLVTAATKGLHSRRVDSLTLLQAAFSHNSFGANLSYGALYHIAAGGFRDVIVDRKVEGPIAITHTWNDHAVGLAYPSASRVSQTISNGMSVSKKFGGPEDVFGGLGANGALGLTPAEGHFITYATPLTLSRGQVTNIHCDAITNHNDVGRIECAKILHAALTA